MKKILSSILCFAMVVSMSVTAFAADISTDGGSQNVLVTYGVGQSFTVTIPSDIEIDSFGSSTNYVSAENVMIPHGSTLNVTMESAKADGFDWYLTDLTNNDNTLAYRVVASDANGDETDIGNGDVVLSVPSGFDDMVETALYFELVDEATKAGTYQDTLTFTVSVDSANINLINFTVDGVSYSAEEGMTWAEWVESEYNPDYTECGCHYEDETITKKFTLYGMYNSILIHGDSCADDEDMRVTRDRDEHYEVPASEEIIPGEAYFGTNQ